jgi:hypothetical protein
VVIQAGEVVNASSAATTDTPTTVPTSLCNDRTSTEPYSGRTTTATVSGIQKA